MPLTSEALSGRESGTLAVTIVESLENNNIRYKRNYENA